MLADQTMTTGGAEKARDGLPGRWILRWLGRFLLVVVALTVISTLISLVHVWASEPPDTLPAPAGEDVQVAGLRVHLVRWPAARPGAHPPVLLVHGFAENALVWKPLADQLATDRDVVAVDLAGFGYTEYAGDYRLETQERLVSQVIGALHLDHPVLVGHSMGAAVVGMVALDHPDQVGTVIFADGDGLPFDTSADPNRADEQRSRSWITRIPQLISAYRIVTRSPRLSGQLVGRSCGSICRAKTPQLVEDWVRPMRQGVAEKAWPAMFDQGLQAMSGEQERRITVPRGIIWGDEDARSGGSLTAAQQNLGHPVTVILPGAGHLSMIADPQGFAEAVRHLSR